MHAKLIAGTAFGILVVVLAGCGSSPTYQSEARDAIGTLRSAIAQFDATQATNAKSSTTAGVAATAQSCAQAESAISGQNVLSSPPANAPNRKLAHALQMGYGLALAGFTDCSHASPFDYTRMARAADEIAQANTWLARAGKLDR